MFRRIDALPLVCWDPDPNADAAHQWLLAEFTAAGYPFGNHPLTNQVKGNLGEAIAHRIGLGGDFAGWQCETANAHQPFSPISHAGIDLLWIWSDGVDVQVCLQEVKTSGSPQLAVTGGLVEDYKKLFGQDVQFTLQTRLQAVAYKIQYLASDPELATRLRQLGGNTPASCTDIWLIPTLTHPGGTGLPRVEGTSELACPEGRPGRMHPCPSPIRRSSATMS